MDSFTADLILKLGAVFAKEAEREVRMVVGVKKAVKKLAAKLYSLQALLSDAERRQVMEHAVRLWLLKLKDAAYDIEDLLDDWDLALHKPRSHPSESLCCILTPCFCFRQVKVQHDIAKRIKEMNKTLERIDTERKMFSLMPLTNPKEPERLKTTSFDVDESTVFGRDHEKTNLVEKLCEISKAERGGVEVVSVVGMGGIGKTTFAQTVFNENHVRAHFPTRIWVCVSDLFDQAAVVRAILESLTGATPNCMELQTLLSLLSLSISAGTKFLLVLDDVWNEDERKWEPLRNALSRGAAKGSAILVTSRKHIVADKMGATFKLSLPLLSPQECWSIVTHRAFSKEDVRNKKDFKELIVEKCKGLPLAAHILGRLLRFKESKEEWERVLQSDLWEVEEARSCLISAGLVSYYDLSPEVRRCAAYCAIFPKGFVIEKDMLISLWAAQGLLNSQQHLGMGEAGEQIFNILLMSSWFIDLQVVGTPRITFKIHDIVHYFSTYLSENEIIQLKVDNPFEPRYGSSLYNRKVRHVACSLGQSEVPFPANIGCMKDSPIDISRSRAFLLHGNVATAFNESLCRFMYLRALVARRCTMKRIPEVIGKLLNLRLLDLSESEYLEELPESLCDLYNLQILNLSECQFLQKLPEGIGKLASLRHLMIDDHHKLEALPSGISRLISLPSLTKFCV